MSCRAIVPGRRHKGGEAELLCRPLAGATSKLVGVFQRGWHRATARKSLAHAYGAHTGGPGWRHGAACARC